MRYMLLMPGFRGDAYYLNVDIGIIPTMLAQRHGWDVSIATETHTDLPSGLRSIAFGPGHLDSLRCIWQTATHYDVLQLMHLTWRTIVRAVVYKARHPQGICYVKLDAGDQTMTSLEHMLDRPLHRVLLWAGFRAIDLISAESSGILARFRRLMDRCAPADHPALIRLPSCGFEADVVTARLEAADPLKTDILYVGRVGVPVKATDVLLDAFRRLREDLGIPARLDLVGPIDPGFAAIFDDWRAVAREDTRGALSILGPISNRTDIMDRYLGAKVFVMCSRSEGVPNVFVEAASCGCLLVGTPVGQVPDVLSSGACGWQVPIGDSMTLARALGQAIATTDSPPLRVARIRGFAEQFAWSSVVSDLARTLTEQWKARRPKEH